MQNSFVVQRKSLHECSDGNNDDMIQKTATMVGELSNFFFIFDMKMRKRGRKKNEHKKLTIET
jgi:hypothetical protein